MRRAHLVLLILILLCSGNSMSEGAPQKTSWTGYLIDLTCARERKNEEKDLGEKHSKKCMEMPSCYGSGFGLLTQANDLLAFDEAGNRKVRALLQKKTQDSNLWVVVRGTRSKDVLHVQQIELKRR